MDVRDLAIAAADPAAPEARACVARYIAEIARRFEGGFDPGRALQPEDEALRPPRGVVLLAMAEGRRSAASRSGWARPGSPTSSGSGWRRRAAGSGWRRG
jgi:hypothetical protein